MGLGPAHAHPSVLLTCINDGAGSDDTVLGQPKPAQAVSVLLKTALGEQWGRSSSVSISYAHMDTQTPLLSFSGRCPITALLWGCCSTHGPGTLWDKTSL